MVIGLVCEFNPFHNGHKYLVDKIYEKFGSDSVIIAVMSGNFTQRAEPAILDKYKRAEIAVENGISCILELPFPYSSSGAKYFSRAAVSILNSLSSIDYLVFGSECGNTELLSKIADNTRNREFQALFEKEISKKENFALGYARIFEKTYKLLFTNSSEFDIISKANNILAIEYLNALNSLKSEIKPYSVKRNGADFNDFETIDAFSSASALRKYVYEGSLGKIQASMPKISFDFLENAYENGEIADYKELSLPLISHFRLMKSTDINKDIADCGGGIAERIISASAKATTVSELISSASTKKYTTARIRRALLCLYFGVTSADIQTLPQYTTLLACDEKGASFLRLCKKKANIIILTKPADYVNFDDGAKKQAELSNLADSIYSLAKFNKGTGFEYLCSSPYIAKTHKYTKI